MNFALPMLPAQLPRWTLVLILVTVPGSTLIVPIVAWWVRRRRQAQRNESMNCTGSSRTDAFAAARVARASRGWQRNLHDFFAPLLGWIADARSECLDPQARQRDVRLAAATDLAELERRARDWERTA